MNKNFNKILLSIVIVSYNSKKYIKSCLESTFLSLGNQISYELILIDNFSTDGTLKNIKSYLSFIKLIKNLHNYGFSKACNQGLKIAKGKYILFLNPDTIVKKGAIKTLINFLQKNPDVGVVGPLLLRPTGEIVSWQMGYEKTLARAILEVIVEKIIYYFKPNWFLKIASYIDLNYADQYKVRKVDWVNGAAIMIRKKILDELGGFDERFFLYYEELDLQKRVKKLGWKIFHLPQAKIVHYGQKSNIAVDQRRSHFNESRRYFFKKFIFSLFMIKIPDIIFFSKSFLLSIISIGLIFTFFNKLYSSNLPFTSFHSDEAMWPCQGYIYDLLISGNWQSRLWNDNRYNFTNPPVSRYVYGWWIKNNFTPKFYTDMKCNTNYFLDKSLSDLNQQQLTYLYSLRNLNKFFALSVLVLSFILFQNLFGAVIAFTGVFFLGFNPLFKIYATRSMAEMIFMFTLLVGLILIRIFQQMNNPRSVLLSTIIGISSGITIMTKPYGVMVFGVWIVILLFSDYDIRKKITFFGVSLFSLILAIILLYHPFIITSTSILEWVKEWMKIQNDFKIWYPQKYFTSLPDFLFMVYDKLVYPAKWTVFSSFPSLNAHLFIPGFIVIFFKLINRMKLTKIELFVFGVMSSFLISGLLFFQIKFERYFLPLLLVQITLQIYTIQLIFLVAKTYIKKTIIEDQ